MGTAISQSSCTLTNATCICTDTVLLASTTACLATACTVREQLEVAKIQEEGCGVPVVSEQMKLRIITYVFCILAEICIIIRLWTKLQIVTRLDADDWVMVVAGVSIHYSIHIEETSNESRLQQSRSVTWLSPVFPTEFVTHDVPFP